MLASVTSSDRHSHEIYRLSPPGARYVWSMTVDQLTMVVDEWNAAIVSNDAVRIAAFMADEWVLVSESGIALRDQFLSIVESGVLTHSAMDRVSDARVRVYGDTAIVTSRVTNTAHYEGLSSAADEWTTDVFVRRGGRWLCVLSQITAARD